MNVSFKWASRRAKCNYCGKDILVDTPVAVHSWRSKKGWSGSVQYHPDCLSTHFVTYLEMNVPKPTRANRGRPSLGLSDDDKRKRAALLKTWFKVKDNPKDLELVKKSLEKLGGVPKSWQD